MSEPFSEELLSAYVDGELPPQVRAAVDRWLEKSPEAQQQVEDFRRLSRLFGDLPRTELPQEFAAEVLQLAERRMLLPDAAAARGRRRFLRWAMAVAAPTAVAAGLLLFLKISNRDDAVRNHIANRNNSDERAKRPGDGEPSDALVAQLEPRLREAGRPLEGEGAGALPPSAPAGGMGGGAKSGAAGPAAAGSKLSAAAVLGAPSSANNETDAQLLAINQAMQEIRASGAEDKLLSVVRVVVVDRAEGLVLLQKAFAANNIRVETREATQDKAADEAKPVAEANQEGLYIEAQADDVIAGFETYLARAHPGSRVVVEESIELAALDERSQKQFQLADREQLRNELRRGDDAAKSPGDGDAPTGAKPAASRAARPATDAVPDSKPEAADAKQTNKPTQPAEPRKKSPSIAKSRSNQRPGLDKGIVEKLSSVAVPNEDDSGAKDKDADASPEANQTANYARQMVVPLVPPAIQYRGRSATTTNSQAARNPTASRPQSSPAAEGKSTEVKLRDENPVAHDNEKLDEPAPALVRMLIVIEHEPQQPDVPAAKKGPGGGAS
jgi:hypothetical protein